MKRIDWISSSDAEKLAALSRPEAIANANVANSVRDIMTDVKANGDEALNQYTEKFDGAKLDTIQVPLTDLEAAWNALDDKDKAAIEVAHSNIKKFHQAQTPKEIPVKTAQLTLQF